MWSKNLDALSKFHFGIVQTFLTTKGAVQKQYARGYQFFVEGYLHDVWVQQCDDIIHIRAKCYHSQRKNEKAHQLQISLTKNVNDVSVMECLCTCEIGLSESCHHVAALGYYIQDCILRNLKEIPPEQSKTEKKMEWNKPRGPKLVPENIMNMVFYKPTNIKRKRPPVRYQCKKPKVVLVNRKRNMSVTQMSQKLRKIKNDIGFAQIFHTYDDDPTLTTLSIQEESAMIEEVEFPAVNPLNLPCMQTLACNVLLSLPPVDCENLQIAIPLEKDTRKQSDCAQWFTARQERFTASKFGAICKRRKAVDHGYFTKLWQLNPKLEHVPAVQYGKEKEKEARQAYKSKARNEVFASGFVPHPYAPFLGCSPDGVVRDHVNGQYGLLEIKCPYAKNFGTLEDAVRHQNFCLTLDENQQATIKRSHDYFYQVQGQLLLTGLDWCEFFIYFKEGKEVFVERIFFDDNFCFAMYEKLTYMYNAYVQLKKETN